MVLSFASIVGEYFDPLAQKFKLLRTVSNENLVQYENSNVVLRINYDSGRSFELSVRFGKKDRLNNEPFFTLAEVLRLRRVQTITSIDGLMVSDPQHLQKAIETLATLTYEYADDFLRCNEFSFAQIAKQRKKECIDFELNTKLRYARSEADKAWVERDYLSVVKALEPVESHLSPAEKKRLDYSRKKLIDK